MAVRVNNVGNSGSREIGPATIAGINQSNLHFGSCFYEGVLQERSSDHTTVSRLKKLWYQDWGRAVSWKGISHCACLKNKRKKRRKKRKRQRTKKPPHLFIPSQLTESSKYTQTGSDWKLWRKRVKISHLHSPNEHVSPPRHDSVPPRPSSALPSTHTRTWRMIRKGVWATLLIPYFHVPFQFPQIEQPVNFWSQKNLHYHLCLVVSRGCSFLRISYFLPLFIRNFSFKTPCGREFHHWITCHRGKN